MSDAEAEAEPRGGDAESPSPAVDWEARELLVDLVSIPSPSGEETAVAECLLSFFEGHGREAWIDDAGSVRAPADDAVLLTSHIDTVPGEVPVRVEGEGESATLYGRGSVDATGSVAAMAVAAVRSGVSFAGVTGEETDSRGARHLIADREAPDAVINGEPSGAEAYAVGYRGFLAGTYATSTASVHTSRPEANAVQAAMAWWDRVESALASAFGAGEDAETFERVTAKPVAFEGGPSADGTAVEATVEAEFRVPPGATVEAVRGTVEGAIEATDGPTEPGSIEWRDPIPPVTLGTRTPVARALRAGIRGVGGSPTPLVKTGTCDVNLYADAWDCPMAVYGPGDSALDHAPNEHLELAELDRSAAVLEAVATELRDQ
jgi:LysW-gamma-L-lysine carboxypeptidase